MHSLTLESQFFVRSQTRSRVLTKNTGRRVLEKTGVFSALASTLKMGLLETSTVYQTSREKNIP